MNQIGSARSFAGRTGIRREKQWYGENEPWASPEVADDAVAVREAEVAERGRRHDVDLDAGLPEMVDRLLDEHPCKVSVEARVGRRQDEDLHPADAGGALRPNTAGIATASVAKT